jgi:hypothetical protein
MYSGDEFYGDDITSGPETDDAMWYRAFCEKEGCLWSGASHDSEDDADGELEDHTKQKHPGEPVEGAVDETYPY